MFSLLLAVIHNGTDQYDVIIFNSMLLYCAPIYATMLHYLEQDLCSSTFTEEFLSAVEID